MDISMLYEVEEADEKFYDDNTEFVGILKFIFEGK